MRLRAPRERSTRGGRGGGLWPAVVLALVVVPGLSGGAGEGTRLRLPPDIAYTGSAGSPGRVVFSHELHVGLSEKCSACHIRLFRILRPTRRVTHAEMEAQRSCGGCHDGRQAFGVGEPDACVRCHAGGS